MIWLPCWERKRVEMAMTPLTAAIAKELKTDSVAMIKVEINLKSQKN